ncbi:MAG: hypothetical protein ACYC69_16675 [Thermodesulfovibrionales bacterium]
MKRISFIACVVIVFLVLGVVAAQAGHRHGWRGSVWIGPVWNPWPYSYSYPYYSPYYDPYYYDRYYDRQPVIIEREAYDPETQAPQPAVRQYWYYCKDPKGYYPYVQHCPGGWKKVLPAPKNGKE